MTATIAEPSKTRKLISIGLTVGTVCLGVVGFGLLASLKPQPKQLVPAKKVYNVDVFVVRETCLRQTMTGFGTVMPDREVTISAQVAGAVLEHELEVGHAIAAQSPVLEIDPRIYQQRHEQAKKQLAEGESELRRMQQEQKNAERLLAKAKLDYETAAQQYKRRKDLQDREIVTPDELARALLEFRQYEDTMIRQENEASLYPLKIDQIQRKQATSQTALELAQLDLNHTQVVPPFSGRISEVLVETGQYVRVGDPLLKITNINAVEIPVSITLSDYDKLAPLLRDGETPVVRLAMDVSEKPQWTGLLTRTAPKADRENRTIEVYVEVDNMQQIKPLLPGTFVQAQIEGPVLKRVFAIPRETIINNHVLIAGAGKQTALEQKRIQPDQTLQNLAILSSDLKEGDQLILTNLDVLYRDPRETAAGMEEPRTLSIIKKHTLNEFLKQQDQALVTVLDCAEN